jgi:hypothetical protein
LSRRDIAFGKPASAPTSRRLTFGFLLFEAEGGAQKAGRSAGRWHLGEQLAMRGALVDFASFERSI